MTDGPQPIADEAEVIVVGAGPAGATCAALLAEWGHDVLVVDQDSFPRDKPCGDGLTRSAVAALARLGLDDLVAGGQPISGARVVLDHRRHRHVGYPSPDDGSHTPRCIRRTTLDKGLLDAAIERGARFVQARIVGLATRTGVHGVEAVAAGTSQVLTAPVVIAADGATSRLRRQCGYARLDDDLSAFAVRAYYCTERQLDPVFDVYVPLESHGRGLAGYGWVFPVGPLTANIGVAVWRGAGLHAPRRLREVLCEFTDRLGVSERSRFGDLAAMSEPFGAPLAVEFSAKRCRVDGVVFVGDAARTTDPLSGEGIAYALNGAETVARWIHDRRTGKRASVDVGIALARRFPRLGQDVSLPARLVERRLNRPSQHVPDRSPHPFVSEVERMIMAEEHEPSVAETPVGVLLAGDGSALELLEDVSASALDRLATRFPFAAELLHRELRSRLGPAAAATAIVAGNGEGDRNAVVRGAVACELIRVGSRCSAQMVDRPQDEQAKLNNVLCVLITDFALSRAFGEAVRCSAPLVTELAAALQQICAARLSDGRRLYDPDRSSADDLRSAAAKSSALFAAAARVGARAGSSSSDAEESLGRFGREVGLAYQIAEDLLDFLGLDPVIRRPAAASVTWGVYPLPVLYAQAHDADLRRLLSQTVRAGDLAEVIERVTAADGVGHVLDILSATVERAIGALTSTEPLVAARLATLARLPYIHLAGHQPAPRPPSEELPRIAAAA